MGGYGSGGFRIGAGRKSKRPTVNARMDVNIAREIERLAKKNRLSFQEQHRKLYLKMRRLKSE